MRFVYLVLFTCFSNFLVAQEAFTFFDQVINPGTKKEVIIPINDGRDSTYIPVTVLHGARKGPVLGVTAGVHGYEYPPILAAQKIASKVDVAQLKGTIILVQLANVAGFLGRSPFVNPIDGKNLNRSFPGKKDGTITEKIAHAITKHVISKSDFFVDMHAGDSPEDLMPYNAWYSSEAFPEASRKGKEMALSMGYDYAVIFQIPEERISKPSIYCSQEAFHRKIPTIDIECGRLGIPGTEETDKIVSSIFRLLSHLNMTSKTIANEPKAPVIIEKRASIKSNHSGIFYSSYKSGDRVKNKEVLGYITDFFGNKLEDIVAPESGILLYKIGTPPINKGETLFSIGIIED
ncbi:succinylglutamate desuccinylase [Euzebyella marina]|uniref:Succinylglutamate desuccinylase n=1 Tax=Euzebyella marina TaxID=1761453 RepID=A0A3G2L2A0_9FLAO|nr:M14 family metallopeptidase [Euzebyella marina]AYN66378.1 succinylglutamate desuccinylase [Euzebyella marina]